MSTLRKPLIGLAAAVVALAAAIALNTHADAERSARAQMPAAPMGA